MQWFLVHVHCIPHGGCSEMLESGKGKYFPILSCKPPHLPVGHLFSWCKSEERKGVYWLLSEGVAPILSAIPSHHHHAPPSPFHPPTTMFHPVRQLPSSLGALFPAALCRAFLVVDLLCAIFHIAEKPFTTAYNKQLLNIPFYAFIT